MTAPRAAPGSYALAAALEAAGGGTWGRWYWRAEPDACEDCAALDSQSFDSEDEVPESPHPNCLCSIEYRIASHKREAWKKMHRSRTGKRKPKHRTKRPPMWTNPNPKPGRPKKKR